MELSTAISGSESLIACHMSDLGMWLNPELLSEVLDLFGMTEFIFKEPRLKTNLLTSDANNIRDIVRAHTNCVDQKAILSE